MFLELNKKVTDLNIHFTKEDKERLSKHLKIWSIILIIEAMQIKITTRYYFRSTRMAIMKQPGNSKMLTIIWGS